MSPLTKPTPTRPVVNIRGNVIRCITGPGTSVTPKRIIFYRRPQVVRWGYIVLNEKALYDPTTTQHLDIILSSPT